MANGNSPDTLCGLLTFGISITSGSGTLPAFSALYRVLRADLNCRLQLSGIVAGHPVPWRSFRQLRSLFSAQTAIAPNRTASPETTALWPRADRRNFPGEHDPAAPARGFQDPEPALPKRVRQCMDAVVPGRESCYPPFPLPRPNRVRRSCRRNTRQPRDRAR